MRVKKIKIGIKSIKEVLKDTANVMKRIEKGERLKPVKEPKIYFTSFDALRKALTPKRLELLHVIRTKKPSSINELARMAKRDVKNVAEDVKYLEQIGLIEKKETDNKTAPVTKYDRIALEIAV
jgi:predicted transcriptional regulator